MFDPISYGGSKSYTNQMTLGISDMRVEDNTIYVTNAKTGQEFPVTIPTPNNGVDGKSAYEIALDNGFVGTEAEWVESLKGADGKDGVGGNVDIITTIDKNSTDSQVPSAKVIYEQYASKELVDGLASTEYVDNAIANIKVDSSDFDTTEITNQIAKVDDKLEQVIESCCEVEVLSGGNPNLLKADECVLKSRLSADSTEILASSNYYNIVTGIIPVEYGKYYTVSYGDSDNNRATKVGSTQLANQINAYLKDGSVIPNQLTDLLKAPSSNSTLFINSEDIVAVRLHIYCNGIRLDSADAIKANKLMVTSADTTETSLEKALNSEYHDGSEKVDGVFEYHLKPDETRASQEDLDTVTKDLQNLRYVDNMAYRNDFMFNSRFLRSISNLRDESTSKEFEITITNNSGQTIKNGAIVVGLHNTIGINPQNNILPFQIYDDIFSESVGFKFFDGDKELPYYIESESDCNYISDKNISNGFPDIRVLANNELVVYSKKAKRMQISYDDGVTWENICDNITNLPHNMSSVSNGDLFITTPDGYYLYKYTSADGYKTGKLVIDMKADGTQVGRMIAEDIEGNLFVGTYQTAWHCVVRKSTDGGDTWRVVFDTKDYQHVHNIYVNTKVTPNEIFLAVDGTYSGTFVSTDAGETWTQFDVPYRNSDHAFRYAGENFYIGCGERNVLGGATLYKTTDYNDTSAYYTLFDNGQGVRTVTNVLSNSDNVLIAGGCVGDPLWAEQLFLSEDKGETWKTVMIQPHYKKRSLIAGIGLRAFSRCDNQLLSMDSKEYGFRFTYGNGAKTILVVLSVGDIPTTGKTVTLKTGYVANVEQIGEVMTSYEKIEGKVADIRICDGYVVDAVSNKRVMTDKTELCESRVKLGQTSEHKILSDSSYRLKRGSVNLGKLSRLNFTKGFTVSFLFKKEDKNYLGDSKNYVVFSTGDTKLIIQRRSVVLMSGETNIFGSTLYIKDPYIYSVNEDYVRVVLTVTDDELPKAHTYTDNSFLDNGDSSCTEYPITQNFSDNDFIVGNSLGYAYGDIPNISRIEIYNRVLSQGEIQSMTTGCNLVTDGSEYC